MAGLEVHGYLFQPCQESRVKNTKLVKILWENMMPLTNHFIFFVSIIFS